MSDSGKRFEQRLAIIVPMANESDSAVDFVSELLAFDKYFSSLEIFILFDRQCVDGTYNLLLKEFAETSQVNVIWDEKSQCVADAYWRGYHEALQTNFEWVLEIDAGYSHQPSDFEYFYKFIESDVECVFGSRFQLTCAAYYGPWYRKGVSWVSTKLANLALNTNFSDISSGYQLFSRTALNRVCENHIYSRGHAFQMEIKFHCRKMAYEEAPIKYHIGRSSFSLKSVIEGLKVLVTLAFGRRD